MPRKCDNIFVVKRMLQQVEHNAVCRFGTYWFYVKLRSYCSELQSCDCCCLDRLKCCMPAQVLEGSTYSFTLAFLCTSAFLQACHTRSLSPSALAMVIQICVMHAVAIAATMSVATRLTHHISTCLTCIAKLSTCPLVALQTILHMTLVAI